MKKTISLVLALVMVFAIASSASAITGLINPEATVVNNAPYTDISLQLIESVNTGFGILSLQPVADNKAYIFDGVVHFALYYKTPAKAAVSMADFDYKTPVVLFSSDIVNFYKNSFVEYEIGTSSINVVAGLNPIYEDGYGYKRVWANLAQPTDVAKSYVIVGSGAVAVAADGTIKADLLGDMNCLRFVDDQIDSVAELNASVIAGLTEMSGEHPIYSGKTMTYTVKMTGAATPGTKIVYDVVIKSGTYAGYCVEFITDFDDTVAAGSHNNVDKILINNGTDTYLVQDVGTILGGNAATQLKFFKDGGAGIPVEVTAPTTYAALKGAYEQVMGFFELEYAKEGVLIPQHFANKFSTFWDWKTQSIRLYTSTITIPDESTDIPQTGDAATSIGFVMIALAIVAACGVAYKKVRA